VAPFIDVGTSGGMHYLVWPLVEGEPLEALVQKNGKLPYELSANIGYQIAQGVNACHQNGMFHGLLKPSNIMVGSGNHVTILDFGIGSLLAENEGESLVDTMSTANTLTSGLDCCAPESILEPTHRTPSGDQYSLGCTLYFCLTGQYPFAEGTAVEKMMAHQFKDPTPLKELVPDIPSKLAEIVARLLKKKPEERYGDLEEVSAELKPFAGDITMNAPAPPTSWSSSKSSISSMRDRPSRRPIHMPDSGSHGASAYPEPAVPVNGSQRSGRLVAQSLDRNDGNLDALRSLPRRKSHPSEDGRSPADMSFAMPPGYVEDTKANTQLSPLFYTVLGMCVMAMTYMAVMVFKPFG